MIHGAVPHVICGLTAPATILTVHFAAAGPPPRWKHITALIRKQAVQSVKKIGDERIISIKRMVCGNIKDNGKPFYAVKKRTGPLQLPESLILEGPGSFAARERIAQQLISAPRAAHPARRDFSYRKSIYFGISQ